MPNDLSPGELEESSCEEAEQALGLGQEVHEAILSRLTPEAQL